MYNKSKRLPLSFTDTIIDGLLNSKMLPYPKSVSIEPVGNLCQLRCPLCPTGARMLGHDSKLMSLETFQVVLHKMPFVTSVDLYKSGEPFLNPELLAMVRHASGRGVRVIVSTHFSFSRPDDFFEDIVSSGLARLVVSLDGASQESYVRYRVGGDYQLVLSNIKKLLAAKLRLNSKGPEIVWQFLVNRFNEHEIPLARQIAGELKITLDLRPFGLADDVPDLEMDGSVAERMAHWLPANQEYLSDCYQGEYGYPLSRGICTQLFSRPVVAADGTLLPCCEVWDKRSAFGNLLSETFQDIWQNRAYRSSRAHFLQKGAPPKEQTICFKCNNFNSAPTLKGKLQLLASVWRRQLVS
jgi:radical SAM protein with 4Fe4S-binding SPASM domain